MALNSHNLDELCESLSMQDIETLRLQDFYELAQDSKASQKLIERLLSRQVADPEAAVSELNRRFESLAERSETLACIFMSCLWQHASELMLHHVCDSIDLWIQSCGNTEIRTHLMNLADSEQDVNTKRHYLGQIESMTN